MTWGNAVMQQQYQRPVGNEESDMSSAENSLTEPEERPETGSFRKITTLGRMTESIAKELNECLCAIVINSSTCLRMLSANPPNVEGAFETARRTIRSSNRAAEAVPRLSALLYRKEVNGEVFCTPGSFRDTDSTSI